MYKYKLTSTGSSSQKYGNCEVCKGHVIEVFIQTEEKSFIYESREHWSQQNSIFGHKECLISIRK
jgi:hypothetical protein